MNNKEIRHLIRKLSRRRHRHLKNLITGLRWPASYSSEISYAQRAITDLTKEIDALVAKLS